MSRDYDVVVIGAGVAGLAAAISAADAGCSVLVIEAGRQAGGSSRLSGGHFYAAGTSLQREAGVNDSGAAMFDHYMTLNQWLVEPSVVKRYCDLSAETFEWLCGFGVNFPLQGLYRSGVGLVPRGHRPDGEGAAVVQCLESALAERGIDLALATRVKQLLVSENGSIRGVKTDDSSVDCGAVIVACGGFGANPDMIRRHFPDAAQSGDWSWYIGSPLAQGDGLVLGQEVGAALDGHNRGLLLTTPGFSHDLEVMLPDWLVLVNEQGRRFTDETVSYTVLAGLILHQKGKVFAVFDDAARAGAKRTALFNAYWVDEVLQQQADAGNIFREQDLQTLARQAGIDPLALQGTVDRYNHDCKQGEDSAFFKQPSAELKPIRTPPFYAVEVRCAIICWTGTGLRIDMDTRVLDTHERPIPGLFAAGETVGSLHGDRYIGGGGSFGPCVVFGKLAGEKAAIYST